MLRGLVLLSCLACLAAAQDLYCGDISCYDVLKVDKEADARAITSAYRALAISVRRVGRLCVAA